MQAVDQHDIGLGHRGRVGRARFVDMRVAVGSDDRGQLDAVAADVLCEVADDGEARHDIEALGLRRGVEAEGECDDADQGCEAKQLEHRILHRLISGGAVAVLAQPRVDDAARAEQHRNDVDRAGRQDDRRAGRQRCVIGQQQPRDA